MSHDVIINADDFGLDPHYNQLILQAFERRVISSCTLMANTPAFKDACGLIHRHELFGRVGLHFNLSHGRPLSPAIRKEPLFCNAAGEFDFKLPHSSLYLPPSASSAVQAELKAQWQRCLEQGVSPSHLDSHQHVHNIWPIARIVARFAAEQGVALRLARNVGGNIGPAKQLFKAAINWRIGRLCGAPVPFVCTPRDLLDGYKPNGPLEVIAHPTSLHNGDLGDDYLPGGYSLSQLFDELLWGQRRVAYSDLKISHSPLESEGGISKSY